MDPARDDRSQPFQRLTRWLTPNRSTAIRQYRSRARIYDLELALFEPVRQRAIGRLRLKSGDRVLDVGCGTGLSFSALEGLVGPEGSIVGIEQSPEMIERARARAADNGWQNVALIAASVEEAAIPLAADAALFHFTHDIMRTRNALANVCRHLKPGGRIVAAGLKWAPVRTMPLNILVWNAAMRSTSTLEGLARPWSHLEPLVSELVLEQMLGGTVYIASGVVAG
ncbi:class I SAM-dependent methyltransferase [Candidatus Binatus sp.]|uniref:class I SAM-dependent methyltransferase n=1 Tax=Candidatus Binatus sp. TaxID=2811406 RepID=UPI003BDB41FE